MTLKILTSNELATATISMESGYGTEDSDYPLANLIDGDVNPVARITSNGSGVIAIRIDLGAATDIDFIAITGFNIPPSATVRFKYQASGTYGSATALVPTLSTDGNYYFYIGSAAVSCRYWWVDISALAGGSDYDIGEAALGEADTLESSYSEFSPPRQQELGETIIPIESGTEWSYLRFERRKWDLNFNKIESADFAILNNLRNLYAGGGTFWWYESDDPYSLVSLNKYKNGSFSYEIIDPSYYNVILQMHEIV